MRYLSDEWIEAANQAVKQIEPTSEQGSVGYIVTDGPDGERQYRLTFGPDGVHFARGAEADITLRLTWPLAVSIADGSASAQRAVLDGQIRIGGDIRVLLGNAEHLSTIDGHLTHLRALTDYS